MTNSISLVIPTYNRADLIAETIASALGQTRAFSEIVVVDDGSTDDTAAVLATFGEKIRVVRLSNSGVQVARNKGVEAASGDYVTFCDSDDLLDPRFVETVGAWLLSHPDVDAVYTNIVKFTDQCADPDDFSGAPPRFMEGAKTEGEFFFDIPDLYLRLFTVHPFYIAGCTVRTAFFRSIGGFDVRFKGIGAEDGEFTLRAVSQGKTAYCRTPLARVRRHGGNDSADPLHMIIGSAHILEYAAVHHLHAQSYSPALRAEMGRLRLQAVDKEFSKGNFERAKEIFKLDFHQSTGLKFHVKKTISHLPGPVRRFFWKLTQA